MSDTEKIIEVFAEKFSWRLSEEDAQEMIDIADDLDTCLEKIQKIKKKPEKPVPYVQAVLRDDKPKRGKGDWYKKPQAISVDATVEARYTEMEQAGIITQDERLSLMEATRGENVDIPPELTYRIRKRIYSQFKCSSAIFVSHLSLFERQAFGSLTVEEQENFDYELIKQRATELKEQWGRSAEYLAMNKNEWDEALQEEKVPF